MPDSKIPFEELRPGDLIITPAATRFIVTVDLTTSRDLVSIVLLYNARPTHGFLHYVENGLHRLRYDKQLQLGRIFSHGLIILRAK